MITATIESIATDMVILWEDGACPDGYTEATELQDRFFRGASSVNTDAITASLAHTHTLSGHTHSVPSHTHAYSHSHGGNSLGNINYNNNITGHSTSFTTVSGNLDRHGVTVSALTADPGTDSGGSGTSGSATQTTDSVDNTAPWRSYIACKKV